MSRDEQGIGICLIFTRNEADKFFDDADSSHISSLPQEYIKRIIKP